MVISQVKRCVLKRILVLSINIFIWYKTLEIGQEVLIGDATRGPIDRETRQNKVKHFQSFQSTSVYQAANSKQILIFWKQKVDAYNLAL